MSICFESPRLQRGDMLIESMVGVLITSVLGAGLAFVGARVMNSQRDAKVEQMAVERMRDQLQTNGVGLCGSSTVAISLPVVGQQDVAVECAAATATISVGGLAYPITAPQKVDLRITPVALGIKGAEAGDTALLLSSEQ